MRYLLLTIALAMSNPLHAAPRTASYGTWESPIAASELTRSAVRIGDLRTADGQVYWSESRPQQGGRNVLVTPDGQGNILELTPPGYNVRTRVHEYGGMAYVPIGDTVYFSHWADQRLYAHRRGSSELPRPLTPPGYRYADCVADSSGQRLFCVREDHTGSGEPKNTIVAVPTGDGGAGEVLFEGTDFVAYPRLSPDGKRLAWISWDHPNMPWDTTRLHVAELRASGLGATEAAAGAGAGAALTNVRTIAGGQDESVLEPSWDADGALYFVSDRTDWWNLYRWKNGTIQPLLTMPAEFAGALWSLGQSNYALTGKGHALVRYWASSKDQLGLLDLASGRLEPLELPFTSLRSIQLASATRGYAIAASSTSTDAVIAIDLATRRHEIVRAPEAVQLTEELTSMGEPIEYPTANGLTAHAFFYAPKNPVFQAPAGELPPVLVKVHGGPTGHTRPVLDVGLQYWTSRGFAVVDVNYGGSTGYGRKYRERLKGNWGVTDIEDVVAVVRYLAEAGRIDPRRAAIRGGSAGGYTTLAALAFKDVFKAGANYYGVSDLELLARETHKFESRYLDGLVAPLPEGKSIYAQRSPLNHLDGFTEPLITFQGDEDEVVPPSQSRAIVEALRSKGVPVAYIEFAGEQHGFRQAGSIVRATESELAFYGKVFGFKPAGDLPDVQIDNLR